MCGMRQLFWSLESGLLPPILRINILVAYSPCLENCQSTRVVILLTPGKPFCSIGNTSTSWGHVLHILHFKQMDAKPEILVWLNQTALAA